MMKAIAKMETPNILDVFQVTSKSSATSHHQEKKHNLHPPYYLQVASPVESANHIGPSPLMLIRELIQNLLIGFAQAIKVTTLEKSSAPKTSALNFKKLYLIILS